MKKRSHIYQFNDYKNVRYSIELHNRHNWVYKHLSPSCLNKHLYYCLMELFADVALAPNPAPIQLNMVNFRNKHALIEDYENVYRSIVPLRQNREVNDV